MLADMKFSTAAAMMADYRTFPQYTRHGGAYDRGSCDSYYGRAPVPHYYVDDTLNSDRVDQDAMTDEQIAAYIQGYQDNEASGYHKEYD